MPLAAEVQSAFADGSWRDWSPTAKKRALEAIRATRGKIIRDRWTPYPWQRPHRHPEGWVGQEGGPWCGPDAGCDELPDYTPRAQETVALIGGRGIGKTDYGSQHVLKHVEGPACDPRVAGGHRIAIIAPTIGDAVESCANGPSGLRAYDPRVQVVGTREGTVARFPNGARARLFGAHTPDDVNRLRSGGNTCLVWLEEAAAQRHLADVLEQTAFGLRVGENPHYVVSTTPKARPEVKAMLSDPSTILTRGRMRDAYHLPASTREALERKYAGTSIGRQEMDGELLADVDGALFKLWMIDGQRITPTEVPTLSRVVVAVDPNAGGPDECGIVVVGEGAIHLPAANGYVVPHYYVLEDLSARFENPGQWAGAVLAAYRRWGAEAIVAEINNGGDMVPHTIKTQDQNANVVVVHATRGKAVRAEPIVGLYEQLRVHHADKTLLRVPGQAVGFAKLEDQMTTWTDLDGYSPDRMDALVWGMTELAITPSGSSMFAVV